MITIYDEGDLVQVSCIFVDSTGTRQDPTVVKFSYMAEALGVTTTITYGVGSIVRVSAGSYYYSVNTSESTGKIFWRFFSTGNYQSAVEDVFYVRPKKTG